MIELQVTTSQLANMLGALAHPHRLLLVQSLADGPRDTTQIKAVLGISQSGVLEHLRVLKAHHVVAELKDGPRVTYELAWPGIIAWLSFGLEFLEGHAAPVPGRMIELPRPGLGLETRPAAYPTPRP